MSSHAFKRHLIHEATFLEPTETRTSSGQVSQSWSPISNGTGGTVVGRFIHRQHYVASPTQGAMMASEVLWMCDSSEDVEEEYRVRNVVDSGGDAIQEAAGTWRVEALIPVRSTKLHHYELTLEKVE